MLRYKWFHCEWPVPISEVASMLMADSFSHDIGSGFKLDKTRLTHISGKYLVKHNIEDIVNDPITGIAITTQRIVYDVVNFNLCSTKPAIEIVDPPRSLTGFIAALSNAIRTNITISNIDINLIDCISLLSNHLRKTKVTIMDCSNIIINLNTIAKLTISGSDDVRSQLKELVEPRKHIIDKARISFMNQSGTTSWFDITNKGTVKIADRDAEIILPILKDCISILSK